MTTRGADEGRRGGLRHRGARAFGFGLFLMGLGAPALQACSVLVKSDQCATDADCEKKGGAFAGSVCSAGLCTSSMGITAGKACDKNAACGANAICNKTSKQCVSLLSEDCVRVVGDPTNDDAIIVGSVLKIVGEGLGGSPSMVAGAELARNEITEVARGLPNPSGGAPRPLVLVECNQLVDAVRATKYLTSTIGVPAIIGASSSGTTTTIATEVTIPGKVLLLSPTATSPTLTDLADDGLVWRTSPSDTFQGRVMAQLYPTLESRIVTATPALAGKVRVALAVKGDTYGKGLRDVIVGGLTVNGSAAATQLGTTFVSKEYENTDDNPSYDFTPFVSDLYAFKPHVVIVAGTSEAVSVIMGLEARLQPGDPRPLYLAADGLVTQDLPDAIDKTTPDVASSIRSRITATLPGNLRSQSFMNFKLRFDAKYGSQGLDATNGALGYDSFYMLAYAIVAAQAQTVSGPNIAEGLKKVTGTTGPLVAFEPNKINQNIQLLASGQSVNAVGASGPLDCKPDTGDPAADIDVQDFCATGGKTSWRSSGLVYDAATDKFQGSVAPCP